MADVPPVPTEAPDAHEAIDDLVDVARDIANDPGGAWFNGGHYRARERIGSAAASIFAAGVAAGRTQAAADIRGLLVTICTDGAGRHLIELAARTAEGAGGRYRHVRLGDSSPHQDPSEREEPSRCGAVAPYDQRTGPGYTEDGGGLMRHGQDWRCWLAPHSGDQHTARPSAGEHFVKFTGSLERGTDG